MSVTDFAGIFNAKRAPVGTSTLSSSQINRIRIVSLILTDVLKIPQEEFQESFTRDKQPDREIVIWENIAKIYQQFDAKTIRSERERKSAYKLILAVSMVTGKELEGAIATCELSFEAMLSIVNAMRP